MTEHQRRGSRRSFLRRALLLTLLAAGVAGAQEAEDWRAEFEAVCGTTDASMSFTVEELTDLIARCDKLAERIGAEEESVRRVYLRRLKMCRDLLVFVLESKNPAPPGAAGAAARPLSAARRYASANVGRG